MSEDLKRWLLFKNPVFHAGENVSVRKGKRWSRMTWPEDILQVRASRPASLGGSEFLFDAFVNDVQAMRICDIPQALLDLEHDPRCRTHDGLLKELQRVYHTDKVNGRTWVSVIRFEHCGPDPGEYDAPIPKPKVH